MILKIEILILKIARRVKLLDIFSKELRIMRINNYK